MHSLRLLVMFLIVASGAVVLAECPAQDCPKEICSHATDTAASTVDLDVRVMEFDVHQVMKLGFAFWSIEGPGKPWEQIVDGAASGPISLLEALNREGLVQQDFTVAQRVADGDSWETALRWQVSKEKGKKSVWRNLHLRVRP